MSLQSQFLLNTYGNYSTDMNYTRLLQVIPSLSTCNFVRELLSVRSSRERQRAVTVVTC